MHRFIKSYTAKFKLWKCHKQAHRDGCNQPLPRSTPEHLKLFFEGFFSLILALESLASSSLSDTLQARKDSNNKLENVVSLNRPHVNKSIAPFLKCTYLCGDAHVRKPPFPAFNFIVSPENMQIKEFYKKLFSYISKVMSKDANPQMSKKTK